MWTRNFECGITVPSLKRFKKFALIALLSQVILATSLSAALTIHFEGTVEEDLAAGLFGGGRQYIVSVDKEIIGPTPRKTPLLVSLPVSWPCENTGTVDPLTVGDKVEVSGFYADDGSDCYVSLCESGAYMTKLSPQCTIDVVFNSGKTCFEPGDTVPITIEFKKGGVLTNPSAKQINSTGPDGTTTDITSQFLADPNQSGVWIYDKGLQSDETSGATTLKVSGTISGCDAQRTKTFEVKDDCAEAYTSTCFGDDKIYKLYGDTRGDIETDADAPYYTLLYDIFSAGATYDPLYVYFLWRTKIGHSEFTTDDIAFWAWIDADDDATTGNHGYEYLVLFGMEGGKVRSESGLYDLTSLEEPAPNIYQLTSVDYCNNGFLEVRIPKTKLAATGRVRVAMGLDVNYFYTQGSKRYMDEAPPFYIDAKAFPKRVHNITTAEDFATIQGAVSNASANDVIQVDAGTFEENVTVDKEGLTLRSTSGASVTIVKAAKTDVDVFKVTAGGVTIDGFTITGTETAHSAGIFLTGWSTPALESVRSCHILNNIIKDNQYGISLSHADENFIENNHFESNDDGLELYNSSTGNEIKDNLFSSNTLGLSIGTTYPNGVFDNRVYRNTFRENDRGVTAGGNSNNTEFFHNKFIGNSFYHARDSKDPSLKDANAWNKPRPMGGNYWSGHLCQDDDTDGFCENPFQLFRAGETFTVEDFLPLASETLPAKLVHLIRNETEVGTYYFIQEAINAANDGDVLKVDAGTFEENVRINKYNLTIESTSGSAKTIVKALNPNDYVFWIQRGGVTLKGFTIEGAKSDSGTDPKAGVYSYSALSKILNNVVTGNDVGIWIAGSGTHSTIKDNIVDHNSGIGIAVEGYVLGGGTISYTENNVIEGNEVSFNPSGIYLAFAKNNTVERNLVKANNIGLNFNAEAKDNVVTGNTIQDNTSYGLYFSDATLTGNTIYYNVFIDNNTHAYDAGSNAWNRPFPLGGNYWSGFVASDDDNDGIFDTSYSIEGDSNQDSRPLASETLPQKLVHLFRGDTFISDYYFIHTAVEEAVSGDTIKVDAGTFPGNITIDKSLTIESTAGASSTVVKAKDDENPVFKITADNVTIKGFTIRDSDSVMWSAAGIWLESVEGCHIRENEVANNRFGIKIKDAKQKNIIKENTFVDNWDVNILLEDSENNLIEENTVVACMDEQTWPNYGIKLSGSKANIVKNNKLFPSDPSALYYCELDIGIALTDSSTGNTIIGNTISHSQNTGIEFGQFSKGNTIYHNNFIENNIQAQDYNSYMWYTDTNTWYVEILDGPTGGNYWSDHIARDDDGDDIFDVPYTVTFTAAGDIYEDKLPFTYKDAWKYPGSPVHNVTTDQRFGSIQAAIDAASTDDIIEVGVGVFTESVEITKGLTIRSRLGVAYTSIQASQADSPVFNVTKVTDGNVTISGFEIKGAEDALTVAGIWVEESSNVTIEYNKVSGHRVGIEVVESSSNTIMNCEVSSNDEKGIYLVNSHDNTISNNIVTENTETGIYLDGSDRNQIAGNKDISTNGAGIRLKISKNNTLEDNNIKDNVGNGIWLNLSNNNALSSNEVSSNGGHGISLLSSDANDLEKNTISLNKGNGISLEQCKEVYIHLHHSSWGGVISQNEGDGIALNQSNRNFISLNNVSSNGCVTGHGISLTNSTNNYIDNNIIKSNADAGVSLNASASNYIGGTNEIAENRVGITAFSSHNNSIYFNRITSNETGLYLNGSNGNQIEGNGISCNTLYGIRLYMSAYNDIFHNNIEDNTTQASSTSLNNWDKGRFQGGNYWSDWTPNSKPTHEDLDSDGLLDDPRDIAGGGQNQDHYPFPATDDWRDFEVAFIRAEDCSPHKFIYHRGETVKLTCKVSNLGSGDGTTDLKVELLDDFGNPQASGELPDQVIEAGATKWLHLDVPLGSTATFSGYSIQMTTYKDDSSEFWDQGGTGNRFFVLAGDEGVSITSAVPNKRCFASGEDIKIKVDFKNIGDYQADYKIIAKVMRDGDVKTEEEHTGWLSPKGDTQGKDTGSYEFTNLKLGDSDAKGSYDVSVEAYYAFGPEYRLSDSKTGSIQYRKFIYNVDIHDIFTQNEKGDNELRIEIRLREKCDSCDDAGETKKKEVNGTIKADKWYCDYAVDYKDDPDIMDVSGPFSKDISIETEKEFKCYYLKIVERNTLKKDDDLWSHCGEYTFWEKTNDKLLPTSPDDWKYKKGLEFFKTIGDEAIGVTECTGTGLVFEKDCKEVGEEHPGWGCIGQTAPTKDDFPNWWCSTDARRYEVIFRVQVSSECANKTTYTLTPPGSTASTTSSGILSSLAHTGLSASSSVHLHLYDSLGRHVGVNEEGGVDREIPSVYYSGPDAEQEVMTIHGDIGESTLLVKGGETGKFDLDIEQSTVMGKLRLEYKDVPIFPGSQAKINDTPAQDFSLQIDEDGDGTFEKQRGPDEEIPDSDADGIADDDDFCPGTPKGIEVDSYGCSTVSDSDGDGIHDDLDACPGYDDNADSDADSIPDGCDLCPGYDDSTDSDADGIPDGCDECPGYDDRIDSDNDGKADGCDSTPFHIKADINDDGTADLADAILALQIIAGLEPSTTVRKQADVNGDGKIGIAEVIFILQKVCGLREQ